MYKVGDPRARTLLCMSKDLGWRISDFLSILKADVKPLLQKKPPVPFRKLTKKEKVPAYSFLGDESLQDLKIYLPTLKPTNKWLWQGKRRNSQVAVEIKYLKKYSAIPTFPDVIKEARKVANYVAKNLVKHAFLAIVDERGTAERGQTTFREIRKLENNSDQVGFSNLCTLQDTP